LDCLELNLLPHAAISGQSGSAVAGFVCLWYNPLHGLANHCVRAICLPYPDSRAVGA
jgi:hypothetical protein